MRGYTHLSAGLFIGLLFAKAFPQNTIAIILLALLGAALPDIDHSYSLIGKHFKFVGKLFRHRGIIHSLLALIFFSAIVFLIFQNAIHLMVFAIVYFSHLILDMLDGNIILFLPVQIKYGRKNKLSGFLNFGLFVVFILLSLWIIL